MEEIIYGIEDVSNFLKCERKSIYRIIARGEFPRPDDEIRMKNLRIRGWKKATLEAIKIRGRGKPGHYDIPYVKMAEDEVFLDSSKMRG